MRYLLDTNIVSDLVRNPQGKVAQRIRKVGETQVCGGPRVECYHTFLTKREAASKHFEPLECWSDPAHHHPVLSWRTPC
jgi:tRNA(fMet)-specific endonuclease VapC